MCQGVSVRKVHHFSVHPDIPPRLNGLTELALNLRWTWDTRSFKVFQHLEPELLEKSGNNPVLLLRRISRERLESAAEDPAFLTHLDGALDDLRRYMSEPGWFRLKYPERSNLQIAYFCMEYGLAACLPIYSGGLGVLAGDHLKAASGQDLPLTGVGLLYNRGYFTQQLDDAGWQREVYRLQDFSTLPLRPVMVPSEPSFTRDPQATGATGGDQGTARLKVHVDMDCRRVWAQVWKIQVGRVSLYLLDSNLPENDPAAQRITSELYGGGREQRLAQELLLGIGGIRALKALGIRPQVIHLNEGHAVFSSLERIRDLMVAEGLTFLEARQAAGAGTIFTTHTPVPAGFDLFPEELIERYLGEYLQELGLTTVDFMHMGRVNHEGVDEAFNVAILALRQAPRRNAVSRLHRRVTARMMQPGWANFPLSDMPVASITNGVHTKTWLSAEMESLYDHYLGPRWREDASAPEAWQRVERIPDLELWRSHTRLRERLVAYAREQHELLIERHRGSSGLWRSTGQPLLSDALTIGLARRFATYKRADLLFRDVARLKDILLNENRPVQLIIAGKAHPQDDEGKGMIRNILELVHAEGLSERVVFLEDHDLSKASVLVQGVDVWLNNPRRPFEASGTSGMKVAPNGGLNLSVLDGWWAEGYRPGVGWAIGNGQVFDDPDYQDELDANSLYTLLEREVVPLFYDRDVDGVPRGWITKMKESIRTLTPAFSGDRMLRQYAEKFYLPAAAHAARLAEDGFDRARELAAWKKRVRKLWREVSVTAVLENGVPDLPVGVGLPVTAHVHLGKLEPSEVSVQAYYGRLHPDGGLSTGRGIDLEWVGTEDGDHVYKGTVPSRGSGMHVYSVRVLPHHEDVLVPNELPLITWEHEEV